MRPRARLLALLAVTGLLAPAAMAALRALPAVSPRASGADGDAAAARQPAVQAPVDSILVTMFRGRLLPSTQEVEVTTFFRDPGFSLLATDGTASLDSALEEEIGAHARGFFSLGEVTSLGASRLALAGGAVVVDGGLHATRLSIAGEPVGPDAARLLVSQSIEGNEVVAASVVARRGKTIILAGGGDPEQDDVLLVCLTLR